MENSQNLSTTSNFKPYHTTSIFFSAFSTFLTESLEAIIVSVAICVVLYLFLITPQEVIGQSMYPTLHNQEYLIANKINYQFSDPKRGDIVIFQHSVAEDYIKRIIGMPRDKIKILNGVVYINNKKLDETEYLKESVYTTGGVKLKEGEIYTVPSSEYFVLGDNRPSSSDSRMFGSIPRDTIKAKAWIIYFPFNEAKILNTIKY